MKQTVTFLIFLISVVTILPWVHAASSITDASIYSITGTEVPAGNGRLNFILFMGDGNGENEAGGFDGDDANKDMPSGSSMLAHESFITSIGELRAFYRLCFPDAHGNSTVDEIVIFVKLDQEQGDSLYVDELTIVRNFAQIFGDSRDNPWLNDISSSKQNQTNSGYSGGTILAQLDSYPKILPFNTTNSNWADYGITTGINPFDPFYSDADRILFHLQSHGHSGGVETIFLSGLYYGSVIPEPSMLILSSLVITMIFWRKKR